MKPGRHDITTPRGQACELTFTYKAAGVRVDTTDLKVQLLVRANRYDGNPLLAVDNFESAGPVVLGGSSGGVTVTLDKDSIDSLGKAQALWYVVRVGATEASVEALFGGVFSLVDW